MADEKSSKSKVLINGKEVDLSSNPTLRGHLENLTSGNMSAESFQKALVFLTGNNSKGKPVMADTLKTIEVWAGDPVRHLLPVTPTDIRELAGIINKWGIESAPRGGKGKPRNGSAERVESLG